MPVIISTRVRATGTTPLTVETVTGAAIGILIAGLPALRELAPWLPARMRQTREAGAEVAARLVAYRAEHGDFPDRLGKLEGASGEPVPQPRAGEGIWTYGVEDDGESFYLKAAEPGGYPSLTYYHRKRQWVRDT